MGEIPGSKTAGPKDMHIQTCDRSLRVTFQNPVSYYPSVHLPSEELRSSLPLPDPHWIILPSCEIRMEWNTGQVTFSSVLQSLATDKGPKWRTPSTSPRLRKVLFVSSWGLLLFLCPTFLLAPCSRWGWGWVEAWKWVARITQSIFNLVDPETWSADGVRSWPLPSEFQKEKALAPSIGKKKVLFCSPWLWVVYSEGLFSMP